MRRTAVAISCDVEILASGGTALSQADYDVVQTTQTESILGTLASLHPELIILDLDLPGKGVAEVLHWIGNQRHRPALVVLCSSENLRLLREGFVVPNLHLLIKPLSAEEVKATVKRASGQVHQLSATDRDKL